MRFLGMTFPSFLPHSPPAPPITPVLLATKTKDKPETTWKATDDPGPKRQRSDYWLTDDPGVRPA